MAEHILMKNQCVYEPNCLESLNSMGCIECENEFHDENGYCVPN